MSIVNQTNKNAALGGIFIEAWCLRSVAAGSGFGANLAELLAELVDATSRIHNFVLAGIKRVRLGRYFDFHQWIILTFKRDGLAGLYGGTGQKFEVA